MEIRDAADGSGGELKRLERGLAIVRDALAVVPPERCAAVVSRSRGMLAVPLTWDDTVINFLEALDGSSLTGRGTNLESLVDAAAGAFANTSSARKTIILVSDGEALSGNLKTALDRCIREGIMVCAVAAGSDEGRPVPGLDTVSRRDASAMRTAAEKTEGIYIDGNSKDAAAILAGFLRSKSGDTGGRTKREQKQRWLLFAVLAIISFGASKLCLLQFKKRDDK
jgi:Ca-activated chloride channel family protein